MRKELKSPAEQSVVACERGATARSDILRIKPIRVKMEVWLWMK